MINKAEVIEFFDSQAPMWDAEMIKDDRIVNIILDNAGIKKGTRVLDVACGTGVLFPDLLERGALVTGIDISAEMIKIAKTKFRDKKIKIICGDVECMESEELFDSVVVYNAFPHFSDPEKLIDELAALTKPGGYLTVAHGMSRDRIDAHHNGSARRISNGLMPAEELADLFRKNFEITVIVSDDKMYQVCGRRKV